MTHQDSAPLLCGTEAGYQRHVRAGEIACDDCKGGHALYMRLWRARGGMARSRAFRDARGRALSALARRHPNEYRELYLRERARDQERVWTDDH